MNKDKINIILIIIFLSIIILPQTIFWFMGGDQTQISTSENRKLNKKPEFQLSKIKEFPQEFDDYYNDHVPFRTSLRSIWSNLNYELFKTTIDERVFIGDDNWLFLRGENNNNIKQTQGILKYSEREKAKILSKVQNNINKLNEKGIQTYILIIPNKENVYKEKLPNTIPIKSDTTQAEDLIKYIEDNSDVNIVYPKKDLIIAKEKCRVYRKYDTHWNNYGALIGTICLQKNIDPNFSFDISQIKIEELNKKDSHDLANLTSLSEKFSENIITVNNFYPEVKIKIEKKSKYEEYTSNSINDKTILFIGDSFRANMREYLSKLYKKVVYIHNDDYTKDFIEKIKPNIVVIEAAERFSEKISKPLF